MVGRVLGVALAVVVSRLGILVVRRVDANPPTAFPGGSVEPGETPTAAAEREVLEECGLHVVAGEVLGRRLHPRTGVRVAYVSCDPTSSLDLRPAPGEVRAAAWMPLDEVIAAMPDLYAPVRAFLDPPTL